jgi:hypothetical protein
MTDEQRALLEIVRRLEQAWNNGDSVAWTPLVLVRRFTALELPCAFFDSS